MCSLARIFALNANLAACEGLDLAGSQKAPAQPLWGLGILDPRSSIENPDWIVRIPFSSSINPIQLHTLRRTFYASASFCSISDLPSIISFCLVQDKSEHLHHHATGVMTRTARAATLYSTVGAPSTA